MLRSKIAIVLAALTVFMALLLTACSQTTPTPTVQAAALTISTTSLDNAQMGIIYSRTLKASGGSGKYTWSVSDGALPAGMGLDNKSGIISGMPGNPGTSNFTVQVNDGTSTSSRSLSITIASTSAPISVGTTSLPTGETGVSYSRTLTASGGNGTYKWVISNGSLPDGLSLDAETGIISGTPKAIGTFTFNVQVSDSTGSRDHPLRITIYSSPTISTTSLSDGEVGIDYGKYLGATGGTGNYTWSLASGTVPDGLTVDTDNSAIWGTPTKAGTFNFAIKLSDGIGSDTKSFSLKIVPALKPLIIGNTSLANGQTETAYSQTLKASGGGNTYTWAVSAGTLPDGLILDDKTGIINGTPKTAGDFSFSIQVADEYGASTNQKLSITVN